ncbi:LysE family transporter [uncultured Desulfosarcina sp.]|uniref:LysE family translocator n=1 Tax=uncultured Desulfosarcina sp. TaxID=218289 RepID=UPI0029C6C22B|nr:LysE family transporter [uncultured Desulfosarcina sp.]
MAYSFFIKGLIFGFSIAMPVGPIGVLCIRRSLAHGWQAGLLTGTGAATADALYGCVAGFGLAGLSGLLVGQRFWIQLLGGLFLCYLGLRIFLATADPKPTGDASVRGAKGYFSALVLTLTNPMTILSFTAVFAGMGLGCAGTDHWDAGWLVAGVFSGSMAWWVILSSASSIFNTRLHPTAMGWINRISGTVLVGFGLIAIVAGFN